MSNMYKQQHLSFWNNIQESQESDGLQARQLKFKPVETVKCNYNSSSLVTLYRNRRNKLHKTVSTKLYTTHNMHCHLKT
jgi:hypothetical protein